MIDFRTLISIYSFDGSRMIGGKFFPKVPIKIGKRGDFWWAIHIILEGFFSGDPTGG